jgi:serine/threonine protein kinase
VLETNSEIEVFSPKGREKLLVRGARGHGGQGVIYSLQAKDGTLAVLKVPGPKGVIAAEIERRILEKLEPHRNVVRLLGSAYVQGVECAVLAWAHDNPFERMNRPTVSPAVMSYRAESAPRIPVPATTAIEIVQEVLAALEHLHGRGYVHGDVKSPNVMVEITAPSMVISHRDYFAAIQQRAYRTLLIDFGTTRSTLYLSNVGTREEQIVPPELTPIYAPPEVIRGVGDSKGGPPTDVYSVGLLLYELVTGNYPYDHVVEPTKLTTFSQELIELKRDEMQGVRRAFDVDRIVHARQHDVVFAEAFAAQRLRDRFYETVVRVLEATLAPDPQRRPTAASLRADFIRLFELEPTSQVMSDRRQLVSMTNPRWHLVRQNRYFDAARVPDDPGTGPTPFSPIETVPGVPGAGANVPRPDPTNFKIALVDDDKVTLTILTGTLRRRGFKVRAFQDPEQALLVLSRDHPDVAIFDMQMPGITGLELVRRLQERVHANAFPIMILSSENEESTLAEAFHLGVTDYLVKPVSEAELVVKLEQAHARVSARPPEQVPRELAGYELHEEVRRGEVGIIFRATTPTEPDLVRAVKVLRPDVAGDAEPLLRIRREIDLLAACDHPAIPRLLASGLVGRLIFFVADEVPVKTLGELVRERGKLSPEEVTILIRDVGDALRHLHSRHIFHGDITPESVSFTERGKTTIGDLGHARWLDAAPREDEPAPQASRYTAPELKMDPHRRELRSDLYSLGVCALEALTGKPAVVGGARDTVDTKLLANFAPLALAKVIERLVARFPDDRFPSASALLEAIG